MLGLALLLGFVRFALGPTLADRVVALDLIGYLIIGYMTVHAVDALRPAFLDAALALALFVFLGTVIFGRYIEREQMKAVAAAAERAT
ncbi:MAG: pH regulation protein F [Planctomycetes bacterium]|nr:pH regulation protein F [Planctomycetota bacterium]MCW8137376.1 pH regulation protein F [Planctomycetota bacterium]